MLDVTVQEKIRAHFLQTVEDLEKRFTITMLLQSILPIVLTLLTALFAEKLIPLLAIIIPLTCLTAPLTLSNISIKPITQEQDISYISPEYKFSPIHKLLQLASDEEKYEIKLNILNCLYKGTCADLESLLSRTLSKSRKVAYLEQYKLRRVLQEHAHRLVHKLIFTCSISLLAISILVPLVMFALCKTLNVSYFLVKELSVFVIIPSCVGYLVSMRLIMKKVRKSIGIGEKVFMMERFFEIMCVVGTVLGLVWVCV